MMEQTNTGLVSVIIPVYNVEPYLRECLDSVVNQTYQNLEILLVDDGSTDGSSSICDEYALADKRIRVFHQKNAGQSVARNAGLDVAGGEYVCFVDSDDCLELETIESALKSLGDHGVDVVFIPKAKYVMGRESWPSPERDIKPGVMDCSRAIPTLSPCVRYLIRRRFLETAGIRFYPGIIQEDDLFSFLLLLKAGRCAISEKPGVIYRVRPNSTMTSQRSIRNFIGYSTVCEEIIKIYLGQSREHKKVFEGKIAFECSQALGAYSTMPREDKRAGREKYMQLIQALRSMPGHTLIWKHRLIASFPRFGLCYLNIKGIILHQKDKKRVNEIENKY